MELAQKKPVVIEYIQFNENNYKECMLFIDGNFDNTLNYPHIKTMEGIMRISKHDYIIKGVKGEFYPCKPDIFNMTYDKL